MGYNRTQFESKRSTRFFTSRCHHGEHQLDRHSMLMNVKTLSAAILVCAICFFGLWTPTTVGAVLPRNVTVCGDLIRIQPRTVKTSPLLYLVTNRGKAYTLYPSIGEPTTARELMTRHALLAQLLSMNAACLRGVAYGDILLPDALIANPRP